jgi:hypothetical protein
MKTIKIRRMTLMILMKRFLMILMMMLAGVQNSTKMKMKMREAMETVIKRLYLILIDK